MTHNLSHVLHCVSSGSVGKKCGASYVYTHTYLLQLLSLQTIYHKWAQNCWHQPWRKCQIPELKYADCCFFELPVCGIICAVIVATQ